MDSSEELLQNMRKMSVLREFINRNSGARVFDPVQQDPFMPRCRERSER